MNEPLPPAPLSLPDSASGKRLLPLLRHLIKSLRQKYDGKALTKKAGLSQRHVDRLFKDTIGLTARQYWAWLRLQRARKYLTRTHLSAKEITARLGFKYEHHFTREFKRHFGVPPIVYRYQHLRTR